MSHNPCEPMVSTVPLTLTFCVVAPLLAQVMLTPLMLPAVAEAAMRAWMVLVLTVPLLGVSISEVCQVLPLSLDNSTPEGAVTMRFAVRLLPPTVKDCTGADAVPAVVVPKASVVVLAVTVAVAATLAMRKPLVWLSPLGILTVRTPTLRMAESSKSQ